MTDVLYKEGWTLVFHEEFDGETLDQTKFSLRFIPLEDVRGSRGDLSIPDSCIVLQLPDEHKRIRDCYGDAGWTAPLR